jgi:hypothetical protein
MDARTQGSKHCVRADLRPRQMDSTAVETAFHWQNHTRGPKKAMGGLNTVLPCTSQACTLFCTGGVLVVGCYNGIPWQHWDTQLHTLQSHIHTCDTHTRRLACGPSGDPSQLPVPQRMMGSSPNPHYTHAVHSTRPHTALPCRITTWQSSPPCTTLTHGLA